MKTNAHPKTIRKYLSLPIVAIGGFMVFVNFALVEEAKRQVAPVVSGLALMVIGGVLYTLRVQEERRLRKTP